MNPQFRWFIARVMYRLGLPYWYVTPKWTAEELAAIKLKAHKRAEEMRRLFE